MPRAAEMPKESEANAKWAELDRREASLWRKSLFLLLLLSLTVAFVATQSVRPLPGRLWILPYGLVVLVALFGIYVWTQRRDMARLRGLLQGLSEGQSRPPSDAQLEKLFEIVSRSQHGFRELIDSFDRIAFNISIDGEIRVINREFADILGLPFASIVNHRLEEFLTEPTRAEMERALPRFLEKRCWNGVLRARWKPTNEVRFYDCTLYAVLKDGEVVGASGLARDISSQREAESRFTQLFETLHEGVYFSTPEGKILDVNPALVHMLGYQSKEELLAQPAERLYNDSFEREAMLAEVQRNGFVRDLEILLRRKDGALIHLLDSCVAIRDVSGGIARLQGSLVDVTERRQMERQLREEQEFVRRLVACFPDVIVVLDTQGRYTFVSPRIQELLGYTPEEFVGGSLDERPHPEDRQNVLKFFHELVSGATVIGTVEYRTRHKDGRWRTFRANAGPLTDAEGKVIGVVASARDVTESKRLEEQLLQSEKLAAIGQMVSGVAHELNNPLTAIIGVSELLRERVADDSSRRQVELIQKQARKAAGLVEGLLTFSRPSHPRRQPVELLDLVRRAMELHRGTLEKHSIAIELTTTADLPSVEADPNQLVQVLVNLLANSEQAIASVRARGKIQIRVTMTDKMAEVLIDDDGPGIPAEIRPKIFDPFFTTRRAGGGSGLGLTICHVIVKEHGGSIEALSAPSGGARFRILLPAAKAIQDSAASAQPVPRREVLNGRFLLVVDDEEDIRELVVMGLSSRGAVVEAARNSEEAWNRLNARSYDAVLCDLNLPGGSGQELFERTLSRKDQQNPLFLFMTGELLERDRISVLAKKGARTLQKPFQISELAATLEQLLAAEVR
jgi:PAS domain S-box-containing protein